MLKNAYYWTLDKFAAKPAPQEGSYVECTKFMCQMYLGTCFAIGLLSQKWTIEVVTPYLQDFQQA